MDHSADQAARLIDMERAQIGHEIHDALLPLIFAAAAGVQSLLDQRSDSTTPSSCEESERLRQVARWLDDAMKTGRLLLTDVYPPELSSMSWPKAAQLALEKLLGDADVEISWDVDDSLKSLDPPLATTAYRVVIEAVRNAVRHGKATRLDVRSTSPNTIDVIDDGVGFDPDQVDKDRFGIRTMRARAQLAGGSLQIHSGDGGTKVTLHLP